MTFLFDENFAYDLVAILLGIGASVMLFFKWKFNYWERQGLKSIEPEIPFGNIKNLLLGKTTNAEQFKEFYFRLKDAGLRHGGIYMMTEPHYVAVDLEIIKGILQTDFQNFVNRGSFIDEVKDPLSANLLNLEDSKWKNLRAKLTPTFTSGKMKMMFQTLVDCTQGLKEILDDAVTNGQPIDIKDVLSRFTTDVIGSCAFGLDCNSLKDPNSEFRELGRRLTEHTPFERLKELLRFIVPHALLKQVGFKITKSGVESFVMDVVKKTVDYREANNVYRKDFMHLLLQLKNRGTIDDHESVTSVSRTTMEDPLTLEQLAAQVFIFFLGGFETSATTATHALFELATNPEIQDKLRQEICGVSAKYNNQITYEGIMDMTFMDRVIKETLRKYPPVVRLRRRCSSDYKVPGTSVTIRKGIMVQIPLYGIHHDPEYYLDPEKFDPDRFTEENKNKRPAFTWIPFGEGPRNCIGERFGLMQTKVALTSTIGNYRVKLNSKTQTPLVIDKNSLALSMVGGIWLDVKNRD